MTRDDSPQGPLGATVDRLRQEFERWLAAATTQGGRALDAFGMGGTCAWTPAADVCERAEDVVVLLDVPGISPDAIEVSLVGNMLTVSGERLLCEVEAGTTRHLHERCGGRFARSIPMPVSVNPEAVSAEAKDGVLRICLAKSETAKSRRIAVQAGSPACATVPTT